MSKYIQRQCRCLALLLLALGIASPTHARDIIEVPAALFFTKDQTPGIQLVEPEPNCCTTPYGVLFASPPQIPIGPVDPTTGPFFTVTTDESLWYLQQDDFAASSISQFRNLGIQIGQEAVRTRLRPFLATWIYDIEEDTFTIADRSLGPMLAERPQTMGKNRVAIGWSYQQVNWDRFNGEKLDGLRFKINHKDVNGDGRLTGQETDFLLVDLDFKLEQDFVDFYVEYGITNNLDISIVVPLVQTNLELTAFAGRIQQADPNDPNIDLTEPGVDLTFAGLVNHPDPRHDDPPLNNNDQWTLFHSRRAHVFCDSDLDETFFSVQSPPSVAANQFESVGCPGGQVQARGDPAKTFFGDIRDLKDEKAIGIGDIRIRTKWHALHAQGVIPDLAWIAEIRPPTGVEDDFHGTGAFSTSNYLVTSWALGPVRPHLNWGVEISAGPDWQDATEWAVGMEWLVFDWLSVSVDQLGRVPFGKEVARRYEYGGGVKLVPTPGSALFFDFIKPINKNAGLVADFTWRVGGQIVF